MTQLYSKRSRYRLISCEVFVRPACLAIATSPHTVDPVFTAKAEHDQPDRLKATIQGYIDEVDRLGGYEGILIGMGLCGNGLVGVKARTAPLVIPRAHDCCTLFLGSKEKFASEFGENLSAEWSSAGYMERGEGYLRESEVGISLGTDREYDDLVAQYGEENARYVWDTLHPPSRQSEVIFIKDPEIPDETFEREAQAEAEKRDLGFKLVRGNMRLIHKLIHGDWNSDEFLVVSPGERIRGIYDREEIIAAESG